MNVLTFIGASQIREYYDNQIIFTGITNFVFLGASCRGDERLLTNCALRSRTNCYYSSSNIRNGYYYAGVTCQKSK